MSNRHPDDDEGDQEAVPRDLPDQHARPPGDDPLDVDIDEDMDTVEPDTPDDPETPEEAVPDEPSG
ncbi:hypothetical protein OG875_01995 [Streptomyces sp. NBC_01498]|uniref:hypothetical protein n=1 Tax=Streptomyces sp. NBC_01498 TaxID=2975870 RepID=UPI002E7B389C|nr:hypothetical protein [Streptomyces sp. NBC_01498]WTL23477.1 hypothetical protein OG875_01995 [Streptomyces sp. NBC_01498]